MPIKLIGRTTDFSGKTLWEILGNLKNFGVGRLVQRNRFNRYPEPSFLKIVEVEAVPIEEGQDRKVRALVEKIFRGRTYPKLIEIYSSSYKADYRLIPKTEEEALWKRVKSTTIENKILPKSISFPPLLAEMVMEELRDKGEAVLEPKLALIVQKGRDNFYRVANETEIPNVKEHNFSSELYKSVNS